MVGSGAGWGRDRRAGAAGPPQDRTHADPGVDTVAAPRRVVEPPSGGARLPPDHHHVHVAHHLRVREDEWVREPAEESSNEHKGVVGRRCVDTGTGIPAPFMWLHGRSGRAAIALLCAAVTRSQSTTPQGTGEETPTGCSLRNGLVAEDRDTFGDLYKILFEMQKLSRESFRGDGPSQSSRGPFLRQILPTTYLVGTVHTPKRSRDIGPVTPPAATTEAGRK